MTDREILWEAQGLIEKYWKKDQSPEQVRLLGFARDALDFISATGQRYRFHDYRQRLTSSGSRAGVALSLNAGALLGRTKDFFLERLEEAPPPGEAGLLRVIADALQFIAATGQQAGLDDYIQHLDVGAPPYVVAAFNTEAEAEAWLKNHPNPPDFAHIIIASEYRTIHHDRQRDIRHLPNDKAIEYYLAELRKEEPPGCRRCFQHARGC